MAVKEGYKQTEVGVIPEDWGYDVFKEITEVLKCGIASTPKYVQNGIPFISAQNIKDNKLVLDKFQRIAKEYHIELTKNVKPRKGDILLTRVGAGFGETALVDVDLDFSIYVSLTLIRMKKNYHPLYYVYLLNSNQYREIARKSIFQGGGVPNLNVKVVEKYSVLVPPYIEQKAIATALSDIDGLINSLSKLIEKKTNIKQGAMQELLTGKKRLEGFSGARVIKTVEEISAINKGYGLSKGKLSIEGKSKCILYGELFTTYKVLIKKVMNSTNSTEGKLSEVGDVLLPGSTTTSGIDLATASALYQKDVLLGGDIIILRNKKGIFDSTFLAYCLSEIYKKQIEEISQGITIIHLHGSRLGRINIKLPKTIEEQTAIATILSDMDSEIEKLQVKLSKYKAIKQGMMQELLTGRIRLLEGA
jgi:type I restriction enzyme, S subunit